MLNPELLKVSGSIFCHAHTMPSWVIKTSKLFQINQAAWRHIDSQIVPIERCIFGKPLIGGNNSSFASPSSPSNLKWHLSPKDQHSSEFSRDRGKHEELGINEYHVLNFLFLHETSSSRLSFFRGKAKNLERAEIADAPNPAAYSQKTCSPWRKWKRNSAKQK